MGLFSRGAPGHLPDPFGARRAAGSGPRRRCVPVSHRNVGACRVGAPRGLLRLGRGDCGGTRERLTETAVCDCLCRWNGCHHLSNDATAVVLTPAVFVALKKARAKPLPYLFNCAFIANAASFVLPISKAAENVSRPPYTRLHQGSADAADADTCFAEYAARIRVTDLIRVREASSGRRRLP